jgi:hypothetical protein
LHSLEDTIFTHEHEISLASGGDDLLGARSMTDESTDIIREVHHFIDTDTSLVSCHTTFTTSFGFPEFESIFFGCEGLDTEIFEHVFDDINLTRICLI